MRSVCWTVLAFAAALCAPGAGDALAQATPACAESLKASQSAEQGKGPEDAVQLISAEKIYIRMQGFPELSSEYRVNSDGTVSIPVIGRVSIVDRTPACLEEVLAATTAKIAKREVYVTVEISAYRPVFVTGSVARPSNIPWFPGMTVLQASAMAGGLYRSAVLGTSGGPGGEPARIKRLADTKKRTLARWARLKAELEGAGTLSAPPELVKLAGQEDATTLIKAQEALLQSRRAALLNEMATIDRSMAVSKEELGALKQAQDRIAEQLQLRRANRQKIQDLLSKGIVRAERGLEEDVRVSDLEQKALDVSVARARVSSTLAGLERESGTITLGRRATIESEIFDVERELADIAIDLQALQLASGAPIAKSEGLEEVNYTIVRKVNSESVRIAARETDVLKAGDVLIVSVGSL